MSPFTIEWEYTWIIFNSKVGSHNQNVMFWLLTHLQRVGSLWIILAAHRHFRFQLSRSGTWRMRTRGWGASYYRAEQLHYHTFLCEWKKKVDEGFKICIWLHMGAVIDPRRARGHGQRVIHSSNLIKNNFCLCFMTTESMALRVLFVCNFLLDETFHWNVFRLFVTWYHLGVRWQF